MDVGVWMEEGGGRSVGLLRERGWHKLRCGRIESYAHMKDVPSGGWGGGMSGIRMREMGSEGEEGSRRVRRVREDAVSGWDEMACEMRYEEEQKMAMSRDANSTSQRLAR